MEKIQESQYSLQLEVLRKTDINIVSCFACDTVILHRVEDEEITCPVSEPCDFADLYHE